MPHELVTFVISLRRSKDRRERVELAMNQSGLKWQFLDAVDGGLLTLPISAHNPKQAKRLIGFELKPGEIGCFLSHQHAWQECVDKNLPVLILEDDFLIEPHFNTVLELAFNSYTHWEILRFQGISNVPSKLLAQYGDIQFIHNLGDPLGTTAYLIKPSAAKKLLEKSKTFLEPVDHFLENYQKHGVLITAVSPYPISNFGKESTIENRDDRKPIRGLKKWRRSLHRFIYRLVTNEKVP